MEKIFAVINQMQADGIIGRYAIGGAVGSIFWLEPPDKWHQFQNTYLES